MPMPLIKHIVVLMLENRSFDHMVGYMQSATYPIDGIDAAHPPTNPMSPNDPRPSRPRPMRRMCFHLMRDTRCPTRTCNCTFALQVRHLPVRPTRALSTVIRNSRASRRPRRRSL
jgi:phospholipase C